MKFLWVIVLSFCGLTSVSAVNLLARLNVLDANQGIREALSQSARFATNQLGQVDGFLGNEQLRIPLPQPFLKNEKLLRGLGMGEQTNELLTLMNRAAENMMPIAADILESSSRDTSPLDAKAILAGDADATTQYFRQQNEALLKVKFLPLVRQQLSQTNLVAKYQRLEKQAMNTGLMRPSQSINLEIYITDYSLKRVFSLMAESEHSIRLNPYQGNSWIEKAFGSVRLNP